MPVPGARVMRRRSSPPGSRRRAARRSPARGATSAQKVGAICSSATRAPANRWAAAAGSRPASTSLRAARACARRRRRTSVVRTGSTSHETATPIAAPARMPASRSPSTPLPLTAEVAVQEREHGGDPRRPVRVAERPQQHRDAEHGEDRRRPSPPSRRGCRRRAASPPRSRRARRRSQGALVQHVRAAAVAAADDERGQHDPAPVGGKEPAPEREGEREHERHLDRHPRARGQPPRAAAPSARGGRAGPAPPLRP